MTKSMYRRPCRPCEAGFSLIEMLTVAGIMAVLLAVGVPKYRSYMATARQSEAKNNLSHIYTLEQTYAGDEETFVNTSVWIGGAGGNCAPTEAENPIGFELKPCSTDWSKTRYSYKVSGATATVFTGHAKTGTGAGNKVSGCDTADHWTINASKDLQPLAEINDTSKC